MKSLGLSLVGKSISLCLCLFFLYACQKDAASNKEGQSLQDSSPDATFSESESAQRSIPHFSTEAKVIDPAMVKPVSYIISEEAKASEIEIWCEYMLTKPNADWVEEDFLPFAEKC